jgi:D-alanine-D-alanine ligase
MEVALVFNLKRKQDDKPPDYFSEYDSEETVQAIAGALTKKGYKLRLIEANADLFILLREKRPDIIFNIAEGNGNFRFRESQVPAILDFLKIPYTGSGTLTLALALNKAMTKKILRGEDIPSPAFQVFSSPYQELSPQLKFPLIVKPIREGSAIGIDKSSVVYDRISLIKQVERTIFAYKQEALVEEFIEGKELTVGLLGSKPYVLPCLEIDFSSCEKSGEYFYSWRMKEYQGNAELGLTPTFHCPARLDEGLTQKVRDVALKSHRALGCRDISRVDIRLGLDSIPYVLEINPLPGLDPNESNFPKMAKVAGLTYEDLIETILKSALERTYSSPPSAVKPTVDCTDKCG